MKQLRWTTTKPRWTRTSALSTVVSLFVVQAGIVLAVSGAFAATTLVITIIFSIIALIGIPPTPRAEARRRTQEAVDLYVIVQDGSDNQRKRVIDRMRRAAPQARYSAEEISDLLQHPDEAIGMPALRVCNGSGLMTVTSRR